MARRDHGGARRVHGRRGEKRPAGARLCFCGWSASGDGEQQGERVAAAGGEETGERGAARGEEGATALTKKETRRRECAVAVRGQDGGACSAFAFVVGEDNVWVA